MVAIGVPIKLLHEAQGHIITVELSNGATYRGKLLEVEDSMNIQMRDVIITARDGQVSHMSQLYVRGSHIKFVIVPDMLSHAPMFAGKPNRGLGAGQGRGLKALGHRGGGRGGLGSGGMTMGRPNQTKM